MKDILEFSLFLELRKWEGSEVYSGKSDLSLAAYGFLKPWHFPYEQFMKELSTLFNNNQSYRFDLSYIRSWFQQWDVRFIFKLTYIFAKLKIIVGSFCEIVGYHCGELQIWEPVTILVLEGNTWICAISRIFFFLFTELNHILVLVLIMHCLPFIVLSEINTALTKYVQFRVQSG